jgi:hypothetical protein
MRKLTIVFIAVMAFFVGFGVISKINAAENPGTVGEAAQFVQQIALAYQMIDEGRKTKSPLTLAAAAEILGNVTIKLEEQKDKTMEGEPVASETAPGPASTATVDFQAIFAEAAALAGDQNNEALADIITASAKVLADNVGARQSSFNAIEHEDRVNPNTKDVYTHRFNGRELATVLVYALDDSDIDLQIFDSNGNLVVEDLDYTSVGLCEWTPSSTQDYKIKVVNFTDNYIYYSLFSN